MITAGCLTVDVWLQVRGIPVSRNKISAPSVVVQFYWPNDYLDSARGADSSPPRWRSPALLDRFHRWRIVVIKMSTVVVVTTEINRIPKAEGDQMSDVLFARRIPTKSSETRTEWPTVVAAMVYRTLSWVRLSPALSETEDRSVDRL